MDTHERGGLQDDRGPGQAAGAHEESTPAGDQAIHRPEIGRTVPGSIEDQQLVLDEHGFSDHGPRAAGPGQSGDRRQQMEEQDGQGTHDPILTTS
jgi:hypothetical protein